MNRSRVFGWVTVCALLVASIVAQAQDSITVGDSFEHVLEGAPRTYHLPLSAGDRIVIDVRTSSFHSRLVLRDANGELVAQDDSSGLDSDDARLIYIAPNDGNYTITVESIFRDGSGSFFLSVEAADILVLEYGLVRDVAAAGAAVRYFMFAGEAGDVLDLRAIASNQDDNVDLTIRDRNGRSVARDFNGGVEDNPYIHRFVLPATDTYRVFLESSSDDPLLGDVRIALERTERLLAGAGEIAFQLGDTIDYERITLDAVQGARYRLSLRSDNPLAHVELAILPPDETFADKQMEVQEFLEISYVFEAATTGETRIELVDRTFSGEAVNYVFDLVRLSDD